MKVVTTTEMIELEHRSDAAGIPPSELMEHAGLAIARKIHSLVGNVAGWAHRCHCRPNGFPFQRRPLGWC